MKKGKRRNKCFIGVVIVACVSLFFCWCGIQKTTELRGLVDLQQEIIYEQQLNQAKISLEYKAEIDNLYEMLQQQGDTIRKQGSVIEAQAQYIEELEAKIDSYDFISGWAYKPWQSRAELKDWPKRRHLP